MQPFVLDGFKDLLPAGTYELESEQEILDGMSLPDSLRTSVLIHLHLKADSPTLAQTLTVPWEVLERARVQDQTRAESPSDLRLSAILSDPIVRLLMRSDGVSERKVRRVVTAARVLNALQLSCVDPNERARLRSHSSRSHDCCVARQDRDAADRWATDRGDNEGMALNPAFRLAAIGDTTAKHLGTPAQPRVITSD